ncbi:polysaccharide biosynthesis/export family protein [Aureisphaera galaxeae]|uniref:polysaccharide biosynthesis/export family protein n=1 Tax=Aureisphaera galaxeae TaxID=1538023 RepID=UPI002350FC41|nr:polysaccharide biosynthesis/export family protein [Aureisphaera galaxeae]MDC8004583.1 polysaccharide biosynthesis/export family protein [Aureisphaera galaxeae]
MKQSLLLVCTLFLVVSCATKKQIIYFQDVEGLATNGEALSFEPIIQNNDVLHISISSMSRESLEPFQRKTGLEGNVGNVNPTLQGYLVNSQGNINFPVLGTFKASGKTRDELQGELKSKLSEFITDIVVDVRIMNFKITVLGGVNSPGVYTISDEQVTLPQAIGLAGDLSEDGRRENVMVIREVDGKQEVTKVDLTKTDFFTSPFYYLKQNDVVYVEPSLKGVKKSGFIPDVPALLSLFTVVLTSVILITR